MLTNAVAKAAGAQSRAYKLHDTGGLFLYVAPTGLKSWRMKYRVRGREKLLTIGRFPEVSLALARMQREEAKDMLSRGMDPGNASKERRSTNTFEQLARAWCRHNANGWSPTHAADVIGSLERDVFPAVGAIAPDAIGAPQLLRMLRTVEQRGCIVTAQRIRQRLSEIFSYGIAEGLAESDPAAALDAAMRDAPPATPHPALVDIGECRDLLARCDDVPARAMTRLASQFLALTAVRLDSVRGMRWGEVESLDSAEPLWRVPPERLKLKRAKKGEGRFEHLVPLSPEAVAVLRKAELLRFNDDPAALVFPGKGRNRPIGEGAIGELYKRAGFGGRHVPHGWRSSFSTILNEELGEGWAVTIDRALAHSAKDKVEAAYNRSQLLGRRRELFARWGALLAA